MAETWVNQGGYLSNVELNKDFFFSAQPMFKFRQFTDVKSSLGKHKGNSENWLKVANLGTYGGSIAETNTMPESSQAKSWGTLTIDEYGNSIPFTFKVAELSRFDLKKILDQGLRDDMVKVLDGIVEREFNSTVLRYAGLTASTGTVTTDGTAGGTNNSVLNTYHLRKMILELKKRNVPGYGSVGGDYVMICSPEATEGLTGALESIFQYTAPGTKQLINGEIGKYYGVRFVEDTFASRFVFDAAARTATAKSWTNGVSLDAYMFGQQTVKEAVACKEEVRAKEPTDYGRSHGIAWYWLGGFKLMWAETAADEANARIIKWDGTG